MSDPVVCLVEDDDALREALAVTLDQGGLRVIACATAVEALEAVEASPPDCLLLDLGLPGMDGLTLQRELLARGVSLPTVFLSGQAAIADSVQAMRAGAADFLEKPVSAEDLLASVQRALAEGGNGERRRVLARYARLTPRERQIMALVVAGASSRRVGEILGISPRTVDHHRAHLMQKMRAASLAELGRMAALCGLGEPG